MQTTIAVTVWTMVVYMQNGAPLLLPNQYTSYEECAAQLPRIAQPSAQCVASGTMVVPLPPDVSEAVRQQRNR